MIKIYLARAMSGRTNAEVELEDKPDREFFRSAGFEVLSPVERENIPVNSKILLASKEEILGHWPRDKRDVRKSYIVIHMTPHLRSDGAWHEVGYKRYHLQGPVVHVYPFGKLPADGAISFLEDDYVCDSREEAVEFILRLHGTYLKRTKWRLKKLLRCFPKSFWYQLLEWTK